VRAFVYWNLHRKCWSVKALSGPDKGRVVQHCHNFDITDAEFRVSEAGRQRVLREQRKNVHAGVVGTLAGTEAVIAEGAEVSYNPYRSGYFFRRSDGAAVAKATRVVGNGRTVLIQGELTQ
jgi:hypothetical protein